MKMPIELAEEHALKTLGEEQFNSNDFARTSIMSDFITGYEASQPKWIPFNIETGKHLNTLKNPLLLFDNGQMCMRDDEHPFAIMTHFYPLPEIPSPPKTKNPYKK